ncbi:TPA: hypothetical protein ACTUT5_001860 [Legionella anisa]|uniref:hypothetical protein n=1 Tax=Legionella anisa TaxID=28082 RepID=UPI00197FFD45|nr:hypothetical protein [Legionella anisa]MBN5936461.1 hypothetical protein [Legionella anisa]
MNIYETLLHLATEPYEEKVSLRDGLKSSDAVLNELKKEFSINSSNYQFVIDTRQACETMVYKN